MHWKKILRRTKEEDEKEDEDLYFFRNLGIETTVDGLEKIASTTTDLDALKEKEKNLRDKEIDACFR